MIKKTLKSISAINMGQSPDSTTYNRNKDGLPFFQGNADFGELHPIAKVWCSDPVKIANEGDILISVRAPIGAMNIATDKCCIGRGLAAITPLSDVCDRDYLYYALLSQTDSLADKGTGSTFKAISKQILENTIIKYHKDIDEQKRIIKKFKKQLSAIDEMAEKTEQQLQSAISLAIRINKGTIEFNGKKEPISKYCAEDKRIIQPESDEAKSLKYLGMENIDKDTWAYVASTDIIESGKSTTYYYDESHVLYGKLRPYLKKVFLPEQAGRCSTELIPLLPADTIEREYLALLLTDDVLVSYIMSEATGARMPRTDMKKLLAYKVAVPDIEVQRKSLKARKEQMEKCTILIEKLRKQQENITALRACVFKEAFGSEE